MARWRQSGSLGKGGIRQQEGGALHVLNLPQECSDELIGEICGQLGSGQQKGLWPECVSVSLEWADLEVLEMFPETCLPPGILSTTYSERKTSRNERDMSCPGK